MLNLQIEKKDLHHSASPLAVAACQAANSRNNLSRAPILRRVSATWIYDYLLCLWIATVLVVGCQLCFGAGGIKLTANAPIQLIALTIFLLRDNLLSRRTFGKSLLGLTVIDRTSNLPASCKQSIVRNLVFLGPYFLYQLCAILNSNGYHFISLNMLTSLKIFAISYLILLFCAEGFLMLRGQGLRIADRITGTMVCLKNTNE